MRYLKAIIPAMIFLSVFFDIFCLVKESLPSLTGSRVSEIFLKWTSLLLFITLEMSSLMELEPMSMAAS